MKNFFRIIHLTGILAFLILATSQIPQLWAQPQQPGWLGPLPVEGSWFGIAEALEPVPGFPPTVTMLLSFNQDGILLGTDSTNFGVVQGLLGSPAHGSWARSGPRSVVGTFLWLQHDPEGNLIAYVKVRMEAETEDYQTMSGSIYPEQFPDLEVNPLASDASGIPLGRFDFVALRIQPGAAESAD